MAIPSYDRVGAKFDRFTTHPINHSEGEYSRKAKDGFVVHTNTVEGFFGLLKRGLTGVYHQVGSHHLHRYLAEFDFRYNARKDQRHRSHVAGSEPSRRQEATTTGLNKRAVLANRKEAIQTSSSQQSRCPAGCGVSDAGQNEACAGTRAEYLGVCYDMEKCIIRGFPWLLSKSSQRDKKLTAQSGAIFSVVFDKGMAAKHRLPLSHVINTLRELDLLIRELGKTIQRANGVRTPDGDFGIELLANSSGFAFRKGSIESRAAITKDVANGSPQ